MQKTCGRLLILVYGPSGVGKTTAFQFAKGQVDVDKARFASLDHLATAFARENRIIGEDQTAGDLLKDQGADGFLHIGIEAANKELLDASGARAVALDVGAGFLESTRAGEWLSKCKCIVFKASPEVAYARQRARHPDEDRTLECYTAQEFSPQRHGYYALANHAVDAEHGPDEVGRSFVQLILELTNQAQLASSE